MKSLIPTGPTFLAGLAAVFTFAFSTADAQSNMMTRPNIPYTQAPTGNGPMTLKLDFAGPKAACANPRPTMVMVHGGSFKTGSRKTRRWAEFAGEFAKQGWNSISLSYRLVKDQPVIDPRLMQAIPGDLTGEDRDQAIAGAGAVETTLDALDFIDFRASSACIDPDKVILIGSSAGGATVLNTTFLSDQFGFSSPNVAGVVTYWGALSDVNAMERNDVPTFVVHGTADRTVPFSASEALYARGQATGTPVQLHGFQGHGHSWSEINAFDDRINGTPIVEVMIDWIDTVVSGGRPGSMRTMN